MISFDHGLFPLFIVIVMISSTSGKPLPLAPSQSRPLTLSMQAVDRSPMLASGIRTPTASSDCPTAISEQAESQPECIPSIFQFKSITANSNLPLHSKQANVQLPSEQATQTANSNLALPLLPEQAIQTARKLANSPYLFPETISLPHSNRQLL
jgi:hypothetical protein